MLHEYTPAAYQTVLGGHSAALEVAPGDEIVTRTVDAYGRDERDEQVSHPPNPMNGPFAVRGAVPGDTLAVHIEEVTPSRGTAWTRRYLAPHVVDPSLLQRHPELTGSDASIDPYVTWAIDKAAGTITARDVTRPDGRPLSIPLAPMIGCIGTAPEEGQAISTRTSGRHGGNMDYVGIRPGSVLYLPVFVPGAMLYFGDGHATQGHGEISGTGTETSMTIRVRLEVRRGASIGWPRGENGTHIYTLGNARPLELALQYATTELFEWLISEYGYDAATASLLLGQAVEYEIGNVFDPAYTMVCKIAKNRLS